MCPIVDYALWASVLLLWWKTTWNLQVVGFTLDIWKVFFLASWYRSEKVSQGLMHTCQNCTVCFVPGPIPVCDDLNPGWVPPSPSPMHVINISKPEYLRYPSLDSILSLRILLYSNFSSWNQNLRFLVLNLNIESWSLIRRRKMLSSFSTLFWCLPSPLTDHSGGSWR